LGGFEGTTTSRVRKAYRESQFEGRKDASEENGNLIEGSGDSRRRAQE
jgi:hypothetical protein